jgi:hypothetical protein
VHVCIGTRQLTAAVCLDAGLFVVPLRIFRIEEAGAPPDVGFGPLGCAVDVQCEVAAARGHAWAWA